MASDVYLRRIEEENTLIFGVKWSVVGLLLAVCLLSGCSFFDEEIPRYNTVQGERRMPVLNQAVAAPQPQTQQQFQQPAQLQGFAPQGYAPPAAPYYPTPATGQSLQQPEYLPYPIPQQLSPQQPFAQQGYAPQAYYGAPNPPQAYGTAHSNQPAQPASPMPTYNVAPQGHYQQPAQPLGYPPLQPTQQRPPQPASRANIEAEIDALEREMQMSQQPRYQPALQPGESWWDGMNPFDDGAMNNAPPPQLLPPPPAPPGQGEAMTPQPMPQPMMGDSSPMRPVSSIDVPLAPDIQAARPSTVPQALIPPNMSPEYGQGFLPPSRYQGRY